MGKLASGASTTIEQIWEGTMSLSGFFDSYLAGNNDIPPVLLKGQYVMNTYVIYKDRGNDEVYCAFEQIVPVRIGNNRDFTKMIIWNV